MIILIHYRWKMMNRAWRMSIYRFSKRGQAEGTYNVDIYINNTNVETKNIAFKNKKSADNKLFLQPCLSVEQLKQWGVKTENFPELKNDPNGCTDLSLLAGAVAKFNVIGNRLDLAILKSRWSPTRENSSLPANGMKALMLFCWTTVLLDRRITILMKTGRKIANTPTCALVLTLAHGVFVTTQPGIMIAMGKIAGILPTPMFLAISNF